MRWPHTIILLNFLFLQLTLNYSDLIENFQWTNVKTVSHQVTDKNLFEQLMSAIKEGNLNQVKELINKGVNVNGRNEYGETRRGFEECPSQNEFRPPGHKAE